MPKPIDLFLSHNRADKSWTERLAAAVESDRSGPQLKVFFDKWDIPPGGDVPSELEEGLQKSRHIGLVLSPKALSSDWVTLERSTGIHRDPRARQRTLIPLLRRTCKVPDMLARLNHIDFRREQDFKPGLETLIRLLRRLPPRRGDDIDPRDIYLREDANLLTQHRKAFDRPAFRVPCIMELFLRELLEAIDDTAAAISTGSLYSRGGKLLSIFPDQNEYRLPEFKKAFSQIAVKLTELKREIVEFESFFSQKNPRYSHHANFYAMLMDSRWRVKPADLRKFVNRMDRIDQIRNDILGELNALLSRCDEEPFKSIDITSKIIREGRIGGVDKIARVLK